MGYRTGTTEQYFALVALAVPWGLRRAGRVSARMRPGGELSKVFESWPKFLMEEPERK